MAQKIFAARASDASPRSSAGDMIEVQVDQIVLTRTPARAFVQAVAAGLKKTTAEVAIAYDGRCVTNGDPSEEMQVVAADMIAHGLWVARAGVGFPAPVHLERFASPSRLCVTDEPRLGAVGGVGMLTLVVPTASLAQALLQGRVVVRRPVSVQVLLSGRLRPFVCARDVSLELLRRGVGEVVRRVEEARGAPVVLEFTGPSVRMLSVGERGVMATLGTQIGAAASLFVSDERTEVFLRDQRRSKAHRALVPDAGAPCEEVVTVDLGAVDPLLLDHEGHVRAARDLAGQPVAQALLGGDGGATLRDLFAAAALLKSKRVPSRLDFLLAAPSRQMLEVLARAGALTDLIATGARLLEPDARVASGELYTPPSAGVAMRTCDPEPRIAQRRGCVVASAETLAYAVATGEVGDPRAFKRPVRVTVPRDLPTDDVLVTRKAARGAGVSPVRTAKREAFAPVFAWKSAQTLELVDCAGFAEALRRAPFGVGPSVPVAGVAGRGAFAVVCSTLDEVRDLAARSEDIARSVRAVLAPYIPSALVALLSAAGIAAIRLDADQAKLLIGEIAIALPAPSQWPERRVTMVTAGASALSVTWLALGAERAWVTGGAPAEKRPLASPKVRGPAQDEA